MDLPIERDLEGSIEPGQDPCLGSISPGWSPTQTPTPTSRKSGGIARSHFSQNLAGRRAMCTEG